MARMIGRAKSDDLTALVTEASSVYSQSMLYKLGFKCISEVKYEDFKNEEGEVVFKDMGPHLSFKLMILYL